MPDEWVSWEMVCRFRDEDKLWIELRVISRQELEVLVQVPGERRSMVVTFGDVRKALDELERSAREVERL